MKGSVKTCAFGFPAKLKPAGVARLVVGFNAVISISPADLLFGAFPKLKEAKSGESGECACDEAEFAAQVLHPLPPLAAENRGPGPVANAETLPATLAETVTFATNVITVPP